MLKQNPKSIIMGQKSLMIVYSTTIKGLDSAAINFGSINGVLQLPFKNTVLKIQKINNMNALLLGALALSGDLRCF